MWIVLNEQAIKSGLIGPRLVLDGPSGETYTFERDKPVDVDNKEDLDFLLGLSHPTPHGVAVPVLLPWEPEGPAEETVQTVSKEAEELKAEVESLKDELAELKDLLKALAASQTQGPSQSESSQSSASGRRKRSRSASSGTSSSEETGSK